MKIIPPYQITSEILNLINQAEEYVILVSPYVNFQNWNSIETEVLNAVKRGVNVQFYVRLDSDNFKSWEQIEKLGIKPKLLKNLHAKLYFNERTGIVTSMNLLTSSNINAIEFGSIYDTELELTELKKFIKNHIEPNVVKEKPNEEDIYLAKEKFNIILSNYLGNKFNRGATVKWQNDSLYINLRNEFYVDIDKGGNYFSIYGVISDVESENYESFNAKYKYYGFQNYADQNTLGMKSEFRLTNSNLNYISVKEKKQLIETIGNFVENLLTFKDEVYQAKKAKL